MFKKQPAPKFRAIVAITVTGHDEPGLIDFEFNAIKRKAFNALIDEVRAGTKTAADVVAVLVSDWNHAHPESLVDEPFSPQALEMLLDEFWNASDEIVAAYVKARAEEKQKN